MSSADGIGNIPPRASGAGDRSPSAKDLKSLPATAEDYVAIENRLAAQKAKPASNPQLNSIFDELRARLPK